jgi:excisionase family DNA binding protein
LRWFTSGGWLVLAGERAVEKWGSGASAGRWCQLVCRQHLGRNFPIGTDFGTEFGTVMVHGASMDRSRPLPKLTFSTREVAVMLGVSRPTVDRLVASGVLPSVDLGPTRRTLIPAWAIEELLAGPDRLTA